MLDLVRTEDVGDRSLTPAAEQVFGRELMPWILGVQEAGEAEHGHEPVCRWALGGCGRRPVDDRLRDHMRLATFRGEAGEAAEIGFGGFELKAGRAAHGPNRSRPL